MIKKYYYDPDIDPHVDEDEEDWDDEIYSD